jgi:endonuclease G
LGAGTATVRATAIADGSTRTYSLPTRVAVASTTAQYAGNTEFGVPADSDPSDDFILVRDQYTTSYNRNRGTPNWVSYNIDATHFGTEDRCDCFTFDDALPATFPRYKTSDYTGAGAFHGYGIDRGHLARSFDRTSGSLDNANTFYFSNIIPQAADNNQGPWADLETFLGNLARFNNKEVYVVAGVAGSKGTVKNEGKIVIPAITWKVALILPRNDGLDDVDGYADAQVIAVIMPNDPGIRTVDWETYKRPINEVEQVSGYDLLALLADNIEAAVESGVQTALVLVEELVTDGKLNKGNGNALTVKLEHAARRLDGGQITPAVNQLQAFLQHVDDLEAEGKLSAADADALRTAATEVIESVSD